MVNALNYGALVFRDKFVTGTVDGHNVQGPLTISGRYIVINDPTHPVKIPLPSVNYLPCTPTSAYVWENSPIVVGCTSPVLPPALVTTLGSKALQKSVAK